MKFIEKKNAAQSTGGKAKKLQSASEKYSNSKNDLATEFLFKSCTLNGMCPIKLKLGHWIKETCHVDTVNIYYAYVISNMYTLPLYFRSLISLVSVINYVYSRVPGLY